MSTEPFPGMGMRMGHMRRGMDEDRMEECMLEAGPWLCALGALAISVALYTMWVRAGWGRGAVGAGQGTLSSEHAACMCMHVLILWPRPLGCASA